MTVVVVVRLDAINCDVEARRVLGRRALLSYMPSSLSLFLAVSAWRLVKAGIEELGLNFSLDRFAGAERGLFVACLALEEEEEGGVGGGSGACCTIGFDGGGGTRV